jgi:ankyrin repeat protein
LTTDETENIWDAARHANVHRVEQLLSAGTSANTQDREGVSPLSWAAHAQADGVVELLLRRRADPNLADGYTQRTPLHYAAKVNSTDCVTALLGAGADTSAKTKGGCTPGDWAKQCSANDVIALLG